MNVVYSVFGWVFSTFTGTPGKPAGGAKLVGDKVEETSRDLLEAELQHRQWAAKAEGLRNSLTYLKSIQGNHQAR